MREVRRIGWMLVALAFVLGLTASGLRYMAGGEVPDILKLLVGVALLLGTILLIISGATRLMKGEVRLRPLDAIKSAILIFGVIIGLQLLLRLIFPDIGRDWIDAIWISAVVATASGLYQTAYRKPV